MIRLAGAICIASVVAAAAAHAQCTSEPPNAAAKLTRDGRHIALSYAGASILDAHFSDNVASADFRELIDTTGGVVTHVMKWTAFDGSTLQLSALITGGVDVFPAEVDRRADAMPIVRNSVGPSASLLNRAVYDRDCDWVVSVDFPAQARVSPLPGGRQFVLQARGAEIALRFQPRYYARHRGLSEFRPWQYRVKRESVAGWSSWFAFRDSVTERDVKRTTDAIADSLEPYGYTVIQIDDGFEQTPIGTPDRWLHPNAKFPSGLRSLAEYISARGMTPGIWTNVTFQDHDWALAHPQYFVRDSGGAPAYGNWIGYVMDGSNEATLDSLIRPVYAGLAADGWHYFKVDALRHLRNEGYNSHASFFASTSALVDAYRSVVKAIRREIGDAAFMLACWGVRPELAGLIDATRVGTDGFGYGGFAQYNSFNNVVWRNDPDHIELARSDAYRALTLASLTGSLIMLTDRPEVYESRRVEIARRAAPVLFTLPEQLYDVDPSRSDQLKRVNTEVSGSGPRPFDAGQKLAASMYLLDVNLSPLEAWIVLARTPGAPSSIPLSELGLEPEREYVAFDFWAKQYRGVFRHVLQAGSVDPRFGVQVLCIHKRENRPQVLATSRHVSCGAIDLSNVGWGPGNTLNGESQVVGNDSYTLYVTEPRGWSFAGVSTDHPWVTHVTRTGEMRLISIRAPRNGSIAWHITWRHAGPAQPTSPVY